MKVLVIPDIHSRRFWKMPLEKYFNKVDKIVFLGDYCDPYDDETTEPIEWEQTLNNLLEIIELKKQNPDKIVLLLGNHDYHYRNKQFDDYARSTRYNKLHHNQLTELYNGDNYKLFQTCYCIENDGKKVIFTHAGITKFWLERCKLTFDDNIEEVINNLEETANGVSKLCIIGRERTWFGEKTGSPVWCDIREFVSQGGLGIDNVFQIFGHSRLKPGSIVSMKDFACIDSRTAFILNDKNKLRRIKNEEVKTNEKHGAVQNSENVKP